MSQTKCTGMDYFELCIQQRKSYAQAAKILGCSKSAIVRASKRYWAVNDDTKTPPKIETADDTSRLKELEEQLRVERQKVSDLQRGLGRHVVVSTQAQSFRIAVVSDTHYGSLYHDAGALRAFLEYAKERKCVEVLHAGDVLEGEHMHFGQERELSAAGFTKQLEELSSLYPRDIDLPVRFITGNHDISYRKAAGIDVGAAIAAEMGWENLGDCFGEVEYQTSRGSYRIALLHPGGGTAYALSYRLQKIIEQWEGGKKPNCLIAGHFHKAIWVPQYRNVSAIHPGCFQKQTPFMASKSLAAHVAGVILDIRVGGEELWNSVAAEFVTFY